MLSHRPRKALPAVRESSSGTVAAAHESSISAGLDMLRMGGNAVDAAVAAALVAGVSEPVETSLAGSGYALVSGPQGRHAVDFGPIAPLAARPDMFQLDTSARSDALPVGVGGVIDSANQIGPMASGVPRTLQGLIEMQARLGTLSRTVVVAPAIEMAAQGFDADAWYIMNATANAARLSSDPTTRANFLAPDGTAIGATSGIQIGRSFGPVAKVMQPQLAETLRRVVASDSSHIFAGGIGVDLVASARERGLLLTADDLERSPARFADPLSRRYRDALVSTVDSPSGGATLQQFLAVWERVVPVPGSLDAGDALLRFGLAMRHVFADRYHWLGDEEVVPVPLEGLLDERYLEQIADLVRAGRDVDDGDPVPWATYAGVRPHTPLSAEWPEWGAEGGAEPSTGTTHISAADSDGQVVAITHTAANFFGSGVMCPRTGLMFDSAMAWFNPVPGAANSVRPGARPLANMGPALIEHGTRRIAVGASGGRRLISAVAHVVVETVDHGASLEDALAKPRLDASGGRILVQHDADTSAFDTHTVAYSRVAPDHVLFSADFARTNAAETDQLSTRSAIDVNSYGL